MARPSKYDPETFPAQAEGWARRGLTDEQIWGNLGISRDTFYRYKNEFQEFSDAIKKGRAQTVFEVENAAYKSATGYSADEIYREYKYDKNGKRKLVAEKYTKKQFAPNPTGYIFYLTNRAPHLWQRYPDERDPAAPTSIDFEFEEV